MSTESQIKANRRNAQKSTGPKTAEGKAVVAQNALKHGLFAHENVIKCEKQADFDKFRADLLAGLAPVGGVESMMAERIVSLSWRLKRVERMNSEVIDVKIARIEAGSWDRSERRRAGLLDSETGRSELALGWAVMRDFSESQVLERLLLYEKRIESSLYKAMNELKKLQHMRKTEQAEAEVQPPAIPRASGFEDATHCGRDVAQAIPDGTLTTEAAIPSEGQTDQMKKQSQCVATLTVVKPSEGRDYKNSTGRERREDEPEQSQSVMAVGVRQNGRTE